MSFALSAQETRVDDGHILRARLQTIDGDWEDAEIDLNEIIGNSEGSFEWGGENFSHSAGEITFSIEGDDAVPVLRAILADSEGGSHTADINLSERIQNNNGAFEFLP